MLLLAAGLGWSSPRLPAADVAPPRLGIETLPDGSKRLDLQGPAGYRFDLEISTNLLVWDRWLDVNFTDPSRSILDTEVSPVPWRFYRLRESASTAPVHYILGLGGAGPLSTGQRLANQNLTDGSRQLLAVSRSTPSEATIIEPAGRWGGDTINFLHQSSLLEATTDPATGLQTATRVRFSIYARDNRLWKFDHRGSPAGELWTSLSTTSICSASYLLRRLVPDYADARNSWVFFTTPGPSGSCTSFPDDTRMLGLRLSMNGEEAPVNVPLPLVPLYNASGALNGLVVQDGPRIQAVNANFENPQDLFSVPNLPLVIGGVTNWTVYTRGFLFGRNAPGRWLYIAVHQNTPEYLMGYDLAARTGPVPILRLIRTSGVGTPGTVFGDWTDTDGTNVFLAVNSGSTTSSIVRIDESFNLTTVGNIPALVDELSLTDRHVVVRSGRTFRSVPKTGGDVRDLVTVPDTEELAPRFRLRRPARTVEHPTMRQRSFLTGGELVWYETLRSRTSPHRYSVFSIAADGSEAEPQRFADTALVTWTARSEVPWCVEGPAHAIYLVTQWAPAAANQNRSDYGDQPIVAYAATDRSVLFEVGRMPAPFTMVGTLQFPALIFKTELYGEPLQFGEAGLIPVTGRTQTAAGTSAGWDLLYFRTDRPELIPVTRYGID